MLVITKVLIVRKDIELRKVNFLFKINLTNVSTWEKPHDKISVADLHNGTEERQVEDAPCRLWTITQAPSGMRPGWAVFRHLIPLYILFLAAQEPFIFVQ